MPSTSCGPLPPEVQVRGVEGDAGHQSLRSQLVGSHSADQRIMTSLLSPSESAGLHIPDKR